MIHNLLFSCSEQKSRQFLFSGSTVIAKPLAHPSVRAKYYGEIEILLVTS